MTTGEVSFAFAGSSICDSPRAVVDSVSASDFDSAFGLAGTGGGAAFSTADAGRFRGRARSSPSAAGQHWAAKAGILKSELARKALGDVSASLVAQVEAEH